MEKISRQRIELDKIQSKIIDEFADIVSQEIDLSKTIVKGFYWKAIREWQKVYNKTLSETEQGQGSSFEERKLQANQISDIFRSKVIESTRTDHKSLEVGIKKALNNYLAVYAKR
ncbi:MAG: hypothetical protein ACXADW_15725 [Candidatus Hodarchaeales archaeon]|jgi:hypothetical protein